eukprot:scaffold53549_cov60-Phaeocystis_antarctica.AAC.2
MPPRGDGASRPPCCCACAACSYWACCAGGGGAWVGAEAAAEYKAACAASYSACAARKSEAAAYSACACASSCWFRPPCCCDCSSGSREGGAEWCGTGWRGKSDFLSSGFHCMATSLMVERVCWPGTSLRRLAFTPPSRARCFCLVSCGKGGKESGGSCGEESRGSVEKPACLRGPRLETSSQAGLQAGLQAGPGQGRRAGTQGRDAGQGRRAGTQGRGPGRASARQPLRMRSSGWAVGAGRVVVVAAEDDLIDHRVLGGGGDVCLDGLGRRVLAVPPQLVAHLAGAAREVRALRG